MRDVIGQAAERAVGRLSRRRFIGRAGAGGLALAGFLGLDPLRSVAATGGTACRNIKPPPIPLAGTDTAVVTRCTARGRCEANPATLPFNRLCGDRDDAACADGRCDGGRLCEASAISANNVVGECRSVGREDCGEGEEKCICIFRVRRGFDRGTVHCSCGCNP
jgi:hypothetical protein